MKKKDEECQSGKIRYNDHSQAVEALKRIKSKGEQRDKTPHRIYKCDGENGCNGWHLTSTDYPEMDMKLVFYKKFKKLLKNK